MTVLATQEFPRSSDNSSAIAYAPEPGPLWPGFGSWPVTGRRWIVKIATLTIIMLLAIVGTACAKGADDPEPQFDANSTTISHETTQDISVWVPEGEGPWPVVYALHGLGANRQHWAEIATRLASQGVVVFAADYRSVEGARDGRWDYVEKDTECGYRYVRSIAADYGGDLNQPVTMVGHSMGATRVLDIGLNGGVYGPGGTYDECLSGEPRPGVIVAVAGCHYEFEGYSFGFDASGWTNGDADLVLVAGQEDAVCEPWQSEDAGDDLRSVGYDVDYVEIAGANHLTVIFFDLIDGVLTELPDEPAGQTVVRTILAAITEASE